MLIPDAEHAPGGGVEAGQALAIHRRRYMAQLEAVAGGLAVVGAYGLAGLSLEHQAQAVGGQRHHHVFGVAVVGHDDHGQLLIRQQGQLGHEVVAATAVLVGAHTGADGLVTTGRQEPAQAHLAVEIQGVAGVLLGKHGIDRSAAEDLTALVGALGKQHAHVAAEVFGAGPQATGGEVTHLGVGAGLAILVAVGAIAHLRTGTQETGLVHSQGCEQAAL